MSEKLTHLEHLEDFVMVAGSQGIDMIVSYLKAIRDELAGHSTKKINTTIKYDGAPSLVAGIDPSDGRFFVAKKSVFNKNPKVYKTPAEVDADTSGDLAVKLKMALRYLPALGIKGILQGDFMFGEGDVKRETILGEEYVTFHPNTIVYSVPAGSDLAKQILRAKIGVVWHTMYTGSTFADLKSVGGQRIASKLKRSRDVWFDDVVMDVSGTATLTAQETSELTRAIDSIKEASKKATAAMEALNSSPDTLALFKLFHNALIRSGHQVGDPAGYLEELKAYIAARMDADAAKLKTEKGKATVEEKRRAVNAAINSVQQSAWTSLISLFNLVIEAKEMLLGKLDKLTTMRTFLKTADGFQVTQQEGYVITDHLGKNAVKLVNRLEFSRANFSPSVYKGWAK